MFVFIVLCRFLAMQTYLYLYLYLCLPDNTFLAEEGKMPLSPTV